MIIAIPNDKKNIKLKNYHQNRLKYSLGSHLNVFSRFKKNYFTTKRKFNNYKSYRDNPLPDGKFVNEMLSLFKKKIRFLGLN